MLLYISIFGGGRCREGGRRRAESDSVAQPIAWGVPMIFSLLPSKPSSLRKRWGRTGQGAKEMVMEKEGVERRKKGFNQGSITLARL